MNKQKGLLFDYIKITIRHGKAYAWLTIVGRIIMGVLPLVEVMLVATFIDQLLLAFQQQGTMSVVYMLITGIGITISLSWLIEKLTVFVDARLLYRIRENYCPQMLEKCARLKYAYIEDKDIQDKIMRVTKNSERVIFDGFQEMLSLLSVGVRTSGLILLIFTQVWWCGIMVLFLHMPILYLAKRNGENAYEADKDVAKHTRRYEYLDKVLSGRESVMERNIFGYSRYIQDMWNEQYDIASSMHIKAFLKYFFATRTYSLCSVAVSLLMVSFLLQSVVTGQMTLGVFVAVVSNLLTVISVIVQQLSQNIRELSRKKAYMLDLREFFRMEEEAKDVLEYPKKVFQGFQKLEFRNVSFKYPKTDNYVLKNVSFVLQAGKHYAFVGENAAGKTTIVKLLLGLYDGYEGEILINERELKDYSLLELKELYAVVYQDFAKYSVSLIDNIYVGAIDTKEKKEHFHKLMNELELWEEIQNMPQKEDTVLGKLEEEDRELSMGQWQRIAIARAMISQAPFFILDEPSAALDPVSESHVYKKYEELSKGRTTIFITHRLGAIKLAEEILLFNKGELYAKGTYEELMESCEKFRVMYETQRGWYE